MFDRRYLILTLTLVAMWMTQLSSFALRRLSGAGPMIELGAGLLLGLSIMLSSAALGFRGGLASNS